MEMERSLLCSLIWLNVFPAFQCLEAPANLGKMSPMIISCVGSLKFRVLVLNWYFYTGDRDNSREMERFENKIFLC